NVVHAVVALPVGETGTRDDSSEACRLSFGPHRHVAAIAVAANADSGGVDGKLLDHGVHPGYEVAIVATSEVLDVALGIGFSLAITAARVGAQHKPTKQRCRAHVAHPTRSPVGKAGPAWSPVNGDNQRILLARIVILWEPEPSLNLMAVSEP